MELERNEAARTHGTHVELLEKQLAAGAVILA